MSVFTRRAGPGRRAARVLLGMAVGVGLARPGLAQAPIPGVLPPTGPVVLPDMLPGPAAADVVPWPAAPVVQAQAVAVPAPPAYLPTAPESPGYPRMAPAFAPPLPNRVVMQAPGPAGSPENTSSGTQSGAAPGASGSPGGPASAPGAAFSPENTSAGAQPGEQRSGTMPEFKAVWNNGLFFQTANKDFVAHVGATIQYDLATYSGGAGVQRFPSGTGVFQDGVNFRRGRMFMEGSFYKNFDYKFEIEFFNGFFAASSGNSATATTVSNSPGPTDAWVQMRNIPFLGNVRIGSQKEWFSLEHLNPYRYLEFMERSYLFDFSQPTAFNNGFTPGVSAFRTWADDLIFSAIGFYKNDSDLIGFGLGNGQYAVTGRLAALPVWDPDNECFWHVGGAMSHRDPVNGQVQVRVRDEVRNAPFPLLNLVANTGAINVDAQDLFNLETAAVNGPLTVQAEYTANVLRGANTAAVRGVGNVYYSAFYVESLYFLTGESRKWDNKNFFFQRVLPKQNFTFVPGCRTPEGWGAWEVGARYTYLNADDKGINGGRLNDVTLGLNWYWNPNAKMQFNYDYLYRDGGPNPLAKGAIHAFGIRTQVDF